MNSQILDLIEQQGWDAHSMRDLLIEFIEQKRLQADLLEFLQDQAEQENHEYSIVVREPK